MSKDQIAGLRAGLSSGGEKWATILCVILLALGVESRLESQESDRISPQEGGSPPEVPIRFSDYRVTLDDLSRPGGVAVNRRGEILVADSGRHRVKVFHRNGSLLREIGERGRGNGELEFPRGVAMTSKSEVVVADTGNHRLQLFDAEGKFLRLWGERGSGDSEFDKPSGLWCSGEEIFVADRGNHRIKVHDPRGGFVRSFSVRREDGSTFGPRDVAVGSEGLVFVSDPDRDQLLVFGSDGQLAGAWGGYGEVAGFLARPLGVAAFYGHAYVADSENHRIVLLSSEGLWKGQWGEHVIRPHEGEGKLHYPSRVAFAPGGAFAVVCEEFEDRCQVFFRDPSPGEARLSVGRSPSGASSHYGPRVDVAHGVLALIEPESHRVLLFDLERAEVPIQLTEFGRRGEKYGELLHPSDVKLSPDASRVFVADEGSRRIQIFSLDLDLKGRLRFDPFAARFVKGIDFDRLVPHLDGYHGKNPVVPIALELGENGELYVLDRGNSQVLVLDPSFGFVRAFGRSGSAEDESPFLEPTDLVRSSDGSEIAIVESGSSRVLIFDRNGVLRRELQVRGDSEDVDPRPFSVVFGTDGSLFVSEGGTHRISRYEASGRKHLTFGRLGIEAAQFFKPRGLALDRKGRLFVIDRGHHRVQLFDQVGQYVGIFGSRYYTQPAIDSLKKESEDS